MLGVWQKLWHDGCGKDDADGRRCRGAAVLAALQYRLGGERGFDTDAAGWREDFLPVFAREWRERWPAGLATPNPDLDRKDYWWGTSVSVLVDVAGGRGRNKK